MHLLGNSLGGLVSLLVASRRPDLVASLTLISPAMPVYRVPEAFSRLLLLLLLPGVPSLAERRLAGITPEQSVRSMVAMCFGDPSSVPAERLEQAVQEMRERAEQPWADRALTRSMRGLITSYLRVGGANAWRAARAVRPPTLVLWGSHDRLVDPAMTVGELVGVEIGAEEGLLTSGAVAIDAAEAAFAQPGGQAVAGGPRPRSGSPLTATGPPPARPRSRH